MDYSLLLGIETLSERLSLKIHRIGAPRVSEINRIRPPLMTGGHFPSSSSINETDDLVLKDNEEEEEEVEEVVHVTDVGELMSRRHCFVNGKRVYHFAIIDYLQEWNIAKKVERLTKTVLLGKDGPTLSAIEPIAYSRRFKEFMDSHVLCD